MKKEKLKTFFQSNWKNILLIIFSCIIIALLMSTTCTNHKLHVAENNIEALTDSVKVYQLKNGELMYEKQGFILEKNELEMYLNISKKEVKDLEKKLNSALATIAKLQAQIHVDTIHTVDSVEVLPDSTYNCHFDYNDKWMSLNGVTEVKLNPFQSHTIINSINMDVPLKVGMSTDNKWFITTENPYVTFTQIEGANIVASKPKRFLLGLQLGVGPSFGYGILGTTNGTVYHGWYFGAGVNISIGITYKLFEF